MQRESQVRDVLLKIQNVLRCSSADKLCFFVVVVIFYFYFFLADRWKSAIFRLAGAVSQRTDNNHHNHNNNKKKAYDRMPPPPPPPFSFPTWNLEGVEMNNPCVLIGWGGCGGSWLDVKAEETPECLPNTLPLASHSPHGLPCHLSLSPSLPPFSPPVFSPTFSESTFRQLGADRWMGVGVGGSEGSCVTAGVVTGALLRCLAALGGANTAGGHRSAI